MVGWKAAEGILCSPQNFVSDRSMYFDHCDFFAKLSVTFSCALDISWNSLSLSVSRAGRHAKLEIQSCELGHLIRPDECGPAMDLAT